MINNPIKRHWWFFIPLTAFIGFRILLLIILYKLTGGSEFSSDVWVFRLGFDPFSVITFSTDVSGYSQPPLFPFLLFPSAFFPSLIFDDFLASRISFTCFELISFLIVSYLLSRSKEINPKHKFYVLLIMSFSPLGFMTGTIMRQEEAVVTVFVTLVLLLMKMKAVRWASFVTFLAVISSKILAGIIFFPLLVAAEDKRDVIVWGLVPTFVFIIIYSIIGYSIVGQIPFIGFAPSDTQFCASPFTFILYFREFSGTIVKWLSLGITVIAFSIVWKFFAGEMKRSFISTMTISFCILFLCFYHINTEYHIFLLPLLSLMPYTSGIKIPTIGFNITHMILAVSTWGYGVIFGIRVFAEGGSSYSRSKELILNAYNKSLGFIPIKTFEILLLMLTLLSILAILLITIRSLKKQSRRRAGTSLILFCHHIINSIR